MQDKGYDSEMLRSQRRRRKRIGRIKSAVVGILMGWILLSVLLIIVLFAKVLSLEERLDNLVLSSSGMAGAEEYLNASPQMGEGLISGTEMPEAGTEAEEVVLSSGMDGTENLAEAGDVHKVYLTFDDGPSERTGEVLDILRDYGVKATFFVTGKEDEDSKALYRRIVEEGHTLGMHSYCNKFGELYQSEESFAEDYQKLKSYLYEVTGVECRYYRFLGGSGNQISDVPMGSLIQYLEGQDAVYCDWNVSGGDAAASGGTAEEIVENVISEVGKYKTSVVLLHDSADKSATVEALAPLIEALEGMEAEILPIDESTAVIQQMRIADRADGRE